MRHLITAVSFAVLLAGCGSVGSSVDGRYVQGTSLIFGTMRCDGHTASLDLGGKKLGVTATEITWGKGKSLALPARWDGMELAESIDSVTVYVDGRWFAKIRMGE